VNTTTTPTRRRLITAAATLAVAALALTACGGDSESSSAPDISTLLASTTSDELCDAVPADAVAELLDGQRMTANPQKGVLSCYVSMGNAEVFIGSDSARSGSTSYADVRADEDAQYGTPEEVSGLGDGAAFYESDERSQLVVGVGDKTLTISSVTFGGTPPVLGLDDLTSVATLLLGSGDES
jgi:hypothetical protein